MHLSCACVLLPVTSYTDQGLGFYIWIQGKGNPIRSDLKKERLMYSDTFRTPFFKPRPPGLDTSLWSSVAQGPMRAKVEAS